jgi:hypothetical protein
VELRVPFLDLEFLALVDRMPSRYKVSVLGERKWLYRRAIGPLVPSTLRHELLGSRARIGRKLGFSTPLDRWFGRWIGQEAEPYLLGPGAQLPEVVSAGALRDLLDDVRRRGLPRARQLMSLYVLECWLRSARAGAAAPVAA